MSETPATPTPTPQPTAGTPKQTPQVSKGCGCAMLVAAVMLCIYIADWMGCSPETKMSESFKAGEYVGQLEGIMAYNSGRRHASDDELDGAARRATAATKFDAVDGRDDWIRGYKVGYDLGWDNAKK